MPWFHGTKNSQKHQTSLLFSLNFRSGTSPMGCWLRTSQGPFQMSRLLMWNNNSTSVLMKIPRRKGDMSNGFLVGGCGVSLATQKWGSQFWEFLVDMMWDRYWRRLFFIWSFIQQDCPQYLAASRSSAKSEILDCLDGHCDEFPTTFGLFRKMALLQSEFSVKLSTIHSAKFTSQDERVKNFEEDRFIACDDWKISPPEVAPAVRPSKIMAGSQALPFWDMAYFQGRTVKLPGSCPLLSSLTLFLFLLPLAAHFWN